jgi:hypothetical protein
VQYPVDACANLTELYITAARNAQAARLGAAITNDYAQQARDLFAHDAELSDAYNHKLLDGRWNHMMDQTHIGYSAWNDPPVNIMPAVSYTQVPEAGSLAVSAEGAEFNPRARGFSLPAFDSVAQQTRTLNLFNRGRNAIPYKVKTSAPWIVATPDGGTVDQPQHVQLHIDWSQLPSDTAQGTVTVISGSDRPINFTISTHRLPITRDNATGFVESDNYVSVEAAHTSARHADGDVHWQELPGFGETLSAMTIFPVTAASNTQSSAALDYSLYLTESGVYTLQTTIAPTQNFVPGRGLRFAVSVDDGPRTVIDSLEHNTPQDWAQSVSDGVRRVTIPLTITDAGYHTLKIWAVDPGIVLERFVVYHGTLRPSYLGPPESFGPPPTKPAAIAGTASSSEPEVTR